MISGNAIAEQMERQKMTFSDEAVRDALRVEEILSRAYQIRRSRGGLFGYDLEDGLQAARELAEKVAERSNASGSRTSAGEMMTQKKARNIELCVGFNN